jgi:hypothetical protein
VTNNRDWRTCIANRCSVMWHAKTTSCIWTSQCDDGSALTVDSCDTSTLTCSWTKSSNLVDIAYCIYHVLPHLDYYRTATILNHTICQAYTIPNARSSGKQTCQLPQPSCGTSTPVTIPLSECPPYTWLGVSSCPYGVCQPSQTWCCASNSECDDGTPVFLFDQLTKHNRYLLHNGPVRQWIMQSCAVKQSKLLQ